MRAWILTTAPSPELVSVLRPVADEVTVVVIGTNELADAARTLDVHRVLAVTCSPHLPAEAYASALADALAARLGDDPAVVVAGTGPAERVLLGAVAGRLGCPIVTAVDELTRDGDALLVRRRLHGGIAEATQRCTSVMCAVLTGAGGAPTDDDSREPAPIEALDLDPARVEIVTSSPSATSEVDLRIADRVVAAGRGVQRREDLAVVAELAAALGAALGCSRPLADGLGWLPKDCYIGASGVSVRGSLYVAVGISGQLQHLVGTRSVGTVVAVNNDPQAPIFAECDYGIIGDWARVVPALTDAVRGGGSA